MKKLFVSRPDRALIRARAAQTALEMALRLAQGKTLPVRRCWPKAHSMTPAALDRLGRDCGEE